MQLFNDWQNGPEGRRISNQMEGWTVGERLWVMAEAYRESQLRVANFDTPVN